MLESQQSTVIESQQTNDVTFKLNENDVPTTTSISNTLDLFKIPIDVNLVPYDWVEVCYSLDTNELQSIMKGEVILDLYDTTDYASTVPIESLPLPAWGRIQRESTAQYKATHAWFKIHSDARQVKTIILRRGNPMGRTLPNVDLTIHDIVFINANGVPALGPQMQVRIYPQDEQALVNTKIRKFGCIYRLG